MVCATPIDSPSRLASQSLGAAGASREPRMNLPNRLTLFRIITIPIFLTVLYAPQLFDVTSAMVRGWIFVAALVLTIIVTVTDWLDGHLARKHGLVTNFGKLADPLADKVFVAAAFIALADLRMFPAWAAILVISREFLVTGIRQVAQEQGRIMAADRLAKHKTGWQLAVVIVCIVVMAAREFMVAAQIWPVPVATEYYGQLITRAMVWFTLGVALLLTVASALQYLVRNRDLFRGQM